MFWSSEYVRFLGSKVSLVSRLVPISGTDDLKSEEVETADTAVFLRWPTNDDAFPTLSATCSNPYASGVRSAAYRKDWEILAHALLSSTSMYPPVGSSFGYLDLRNRTPSCFIREQISLTKFDLSECRVRAK